MDYGNVSVELLNKKSTFHVAFDFDISAENNSAEVVMNGLTFLKKYHRAENLIRNLTVKLQS